jgi:hypothetical protein
VIINWWDLSRDIEIFHSSEETSQETPSLPAGKFSASLIKDPLTFDREIKCKNKMSLALQYANKGEENKTPQPSTDEYVENKRTRSYRWKIFIELSGLFRLQALGNAVIASAFPYIATDFSMLMIFLFLLTLREKTSNICIR